MIDLIGQTRTDLNYAHYGSSSFLVSDMVGHISEVV